MFGKENELRLKTFYMKKKILFYASLLLDL